MMTSKINGNKKLNVRSLKNDKILLTALAVLFLLCIITAPVSATTLYVDDSPHHSTVKAAVDAAQTGDTIIVKKNTIETEKITLGTKVIEITADDDYTIKKSLSTSDPLFTISSGSLTIGANPGKTLTLDGNKDNQEAGYSGGLIGIDYGGALIINDGALLTNATAYRGAGVLFTNGGMLTMTGGKISGNTAITYGGNYGEGGGIRYRSGMNSMVFTMTGGEISGNTADIRGAGVYHDSGEFKISGSANITADNDIYLNSGHISLTNAITTGGVYNITPQTQSLGTEVVVGSGYTITDSDKEKFRLSQTLTDAGLNLALDDNKLKISEGIDVSTLTYEITNRTFNFNTQTPEVVVKNGVSTLIQGTHYTLTVDGKTNAGDYAFTVDGINPLYRGSVTKDWNISKAVLSDNNVTLTNQLLTYSGASQSQGADVEYLEHTLASGTDYTLSGDESGTNAGTYTLTVTGVGTNFTGTVNKDWTIDKASLSADNVSVSNKTYTGSAQEPDAVVTFNGNTLVSGTDYTLSGDTSKTDAGDYTLTVAGAGTNFTNTDVTKAWNISKALLAESNITVTNSGVVYDGSLKTAAVTVEFNGIPLTEHSDYELGGDKENASAGDHTLTVTGAGANFEDTPVSKIWTIGKAVLDADKLQFTPTTEKADGRGKPVIVSAKAGYYGVGTVSKTYYNNLETVPNTAGTYPITVDVSEGDNYTAASALALGDYILDYAYNKLLAGTNGTLTADHLGGDVTSITSVYLKSGTIYFSPSDFKYRIEENPSLNTATFAVTGSVTKDIEVDIVERIETLNNSAEWGTLGGEQLKLNFTAPGAVKYVMPAEISRGTITAVPDASKIVVKKGDATLIPGSDYTIVDGCIKLGNGAVYYEDYTYEYTGSMLGDVNGDGLLNGNDVSLYMGILTEAPEISITDELLVTANIMLSAAGSKDTVGLADYRRLANYLTNNP